MGAMNFFKKVGLLVMSVAVIGCSGQALKSSDNSSDQLTDANIAAIVVGANKIDISAGNIALDRSADSEVREFARRMVIDHQSVLDAAIKLVTRLGVTPQNNDLVHVLSKQSAEHEANLKSLTGKEFDKVYIDHEVAYHEVVIGVIKNKLIPGAANQELKDMLTSVLPAFDAHLEHCKNIQASL